MVSGLAPGRLALTEIVGKSTFGSGATGNNLKPIAPARRIAIVSRDVATGRRMKGAEMLEVMFTALFRRCLFDGVADANFLLQPGLHPVKCEINDRSRVKSEQLA